MISVISSKSISLFDMQIRKGYVNPNTMVDSVMYGCMYVHMYIYVLNKGSLMFLQIGNKIQS